MTVSLDVGIATDTGRSRSRNEDSVTAYQSDQHARAGGRLYIIADGAGGEHYGEVASGHATRRIGELYYQAVAQAAPDAALRRAIEKTSGEIYQMARERDAAGHMGTTLVAALILDSRMVIAWVGDSRAYLISNTTATQLTADHTKVRLLVERGALTPEEAKTHPERHILLRSLGGQPQVQADMIAVDSLRAGDVIVLCSDGLTRYLEMDEIAARVAGQTNVQKTAQSLVQTANKRGGKDNISVILLRVTEVKRDATGEHTPVARTWIAGEAYEDDDDEPDVYTGAATSPPYNTTIIAREDLDYDGGIDDTPPQETPGHSYVATLVARDDIEPNQANDYPGGYTATLPVKPEGLERRITQEMKAALSGRRGWKPYLNGVALLLIIMAIMAALVWIAGGFSGDQSKDSFTSTPAGAVVLAPTGIPTASPTQAETAPPAVTEQPTATLTEEPSPLPPTSTPPPTATSTPMEIPPAMANSPWEEGTILYTRTNAGLYASAGGEEPANRLDAGIPVKVFKEGGNISFVTPQGDTWWLVRPASLPGSGGGWVPETDLGLPDQPIAQWMLDNGPENDIYINNPDGAWLRATPASDAEVLYSDLRHGDVVHRVDPAEVLYVEYPGTGGEWWWRISATAPTGPLDGWIEQKSLSLDVPAGAQ